jgi:hypothetical protein
MSNALTVDQRWHIGNKPKVLQSPIDIMHERFGLAVPAVPCSTCVNCRRRQPSTVCRCDMIASSDNAIHGHDAACGAIKPAKVVVKMYQDELVLED